MSRLDRVNHKQELYKMLHCALYIEDMEILKRLEQFAMNNVSIVFKTFNDETGEYTYTIKYPSSDFLRKNAREY